MEISYEENRNETKIVKLAFSRQMGINCNKNMMNECMTKPILKTKTKAKTDEINR